VKRLIFAAMASAILAPAALGQENTAARAEMLQGSWTCVQVKKDDAEGDLTTRFTYAVDGTFQHEFAMTGAIPHGPSIEVSGTGAGTWKLEPDPEWGKQSMDRLTETMSSSTVTSAKLAGQIVDPAEAQAMWGANLFGKNNEVVAVISSTTLGKLSVLTGSVTRCVRPG
jgi:hypothetical protein